MPWVHDSRARAPKTLVTSTDDPRAESVHNLGLRRVRCAVLRVAIQPLSEAKGHGYLIQVYWRLDTPAPKALQACLRFGLNSLETGEWAKLERLENSLWNFGSR